MIFEQGKGAPVAPGFLHLLRSSLQHLTTGLRGSYTCLTEASSSAEGFGACLELEEQVALLVPASLHPMWYLIPVS